MSSLLQVVDTSLDQQGAPSQKRIHYRPGTEDIYVAVVGGIGFRRIYKCEDGANFDLISDWTPATGTEQALDDYDISFVFKNETTICIVSETKEDDTYKLWYTVNNIEHNTFLDSLIYSTTTAGSRAKHVDIIIDPRGAPMIVFDVGSTIKLYYYDQNNQPQTVQVSNSSYTPTQRPAIIIEGNTVYIHASTGSESYLYRFNYLAVPGDENFTPLCNPDMPRSPIIQAPGANKGFLTVDSNNVLKFRLWDGDDLGDIEEIDTGVAESYRFDGCFREGFWRIFYLKSNLYFKYAVKQLGLGGDDWTPGVGMPEIPETNYSSICATKFYPNPGGVPAHWHGCIFIRVSDGQIYYVHYDESGTPVPEYGGYWEYGRLFSSEQFGIDLEGGALTRYGMQYDPDYKIMDVLNIVNDVAFTDQFRFLKLNKEFTDKYSDEIELNVNFHLKTGKVDSGIPFWKCCNKLVTDFDIDEDGFISVIIYSESGSVHKTLHITDRRKAINFVLWGRQFQVEIDEVSSKDFGLRSVELHGFWTGVKF